MTMIQIHSPRDYARMRHDQVKGGCHKPAGHHAPSTNVIEKEDGYELEMAIPGMSREDIKISIEKDVLTISSDKARDGQAHNVTYNHREFGISRFCRSFSLPEVIDREKITAAYHDGILRVELPKQEQARVQLKRTIEIA